MEYRWFVEGPAYPPGPDAGRVRPDPASRRQAGSPSAGARQSSGRRPSAVKPTATRGGSIGGRDAFRSLGTAGRSGPRSRVVVKLAPVGGFVRPGYPRGGFHERPIRNCPIHRPGNNVVERGFPVRRTGLRDGGRGMSTTFKSAAESYARASRAYPAGRANRVHLDLTEVGAVGRRRPDRAAIESQESNARSASRRVDCPG